MSALAFFLLVTPGLVVFYFLFVRPYLYELPAFKQFYDDANGFWAKVWALCGKRVELAFAYIVQFVGWVLQVIDPIASFFGDPDLRQQLTDGLQANPKVLGFVLMAISALTIVVKVRNLSKDAE